MRWFDLKYRTMNIQNPYLFVRCCLVRFVHLEYAIIVPAAAVPVGIVLQLTQSLRYIRCGARTDATEAHRTFAGVLPEWTRFAQIHAIETKVVFEQKTPQTRKDFVVVEIVHRVHRAAAIVDGAFQL